ncbi:hypothetical protein [Rhodococcus sp. NPDC060176]|uniref:hypothetical protein n=1 Tax=Rhodococcus sp. NPDC060176 TaxID=3347062 RepID=UPI00365E3DBA
MTAPEDGTNRPTTTNGNGAVKTLAIRLEPDVHAQLSLIAQLRGSTITDEIKNALAAHMEAAKHADDLMARADEALADIERDAAARRDALSTLFATPESTKPRPRTARKDTGSSPGT